MTAHPQFDRATSYALQQCALSIGAAFLAEAQRKAEAADRAWKRELMALFGTGYMDARWSHLGRGKEGSELRRLFDARVAADEAFTKAESVYNIMPSPRPVGPFEEVERCHDGQCELRRGSCGQCQADAAADARRGD